jgi:hypothetical protein
MSFAEEKEMTAAEFLDWSKGVCFLGIGVLIFSIAVDSWLDNFKD